MTINNYFKTLLLTAMLGTATAYAQQAPSRSADGSKSYTGELVVTVGEDVQTSTTTITLTPNGDGTYTLLLPNFSYGNMLQNTDITISNATPTLDATGTVTTYTGTGSVFVLFDDAAVTLDGTIDALGKVDLDINVDFSGNNIPVKFTAEATGKAYDGKLTVNMGTPSVSDATLYITPNGDGSYTILLPNFTFNSMALGNIELVNVSATTDEAGTTTYAGEGILLGMPVGLNGTLAANGDINIDITVAMSATNIIPVNFTNVSGSISGIADIEAASDNAAEYYTIGGIRIANPAAGQLYIVKQGNKTSKVIVK